MNDQPISPTQRWVLQQMSQGWTCSSHYNLEHGEEQKGASPALWPPSIQDVSHYHAILPRTLAALLRLQVIEEARRFCGSTASQGERHWERWTVEYRLTEKGKAAAPLAAQTGSDGETRI